MTIKMRDNTKPWAWIEELPEPQELLYFPGDPGMYREEIDPWGKAVFLFFSRYFKRWSVSEYYTPGRHIPIMRARIKQPNVA